jgi:hypothetical protein
MDIVEPDFIYIRLLIDLFIEISVFNGLYCNMSVYLEIGNVLGFSLLLSYISVLGMFSLL